MIYKPQPTLYLSLQAFFIQILALSKQYKYLIPGHLFPNEYFKCASALIEPDSKKKHSHIFFIIYT